jgi:hypothetical protein
MVMSSTLSPLGFCHTRQPRRHLDPVKSLCYKGQLKMSHAELQALQEQGMREGVPVSIFLLTSLPTVKSLA